MEDVLARHNLFKNHDDMSLYDGHVRPDLYTRYPVFDENYKRRNITNELNGAYHGVEFHTQTHRKEQPLLPPLFFGPSRASAVSLSRVLAHNLVATPRVDNS